MIGLDSSTIIDLFRGNNDLKNILEKIDDIIVLNQAVYMELMFGIDKDNPKHKIEEEFYDSFFNSSINFDINAITTKKASDLLWHLIKKGEIIDKFDCIIAGIYLSNNVKKIITKNIKHFNRIPDLEIISY